MGGCVIIVEGKTDKEQLLRVLAEPVTIYCTYGSYSQEKGEQLLAQAESADEVYLFTDEDDSGKKLRASLSDDFRTLCISTPRKCTGKWRARRCLCWLKYWSGPDLPW